MSYLLQFYFKLYSELGITPNFTKPKRKDGIYLHGSYKDKQENPLAVKNSKLTTNWFRTLLSLSRSYSSQKWLNKLLKIPKPKKSQLQSVSKDYTEATLSESL